MTAPKEGTTVDGWLVSGACAVKDEDGVMSLVGIVDGKLTFAKTWTNRWGELESGRHVVDAPLDVVRALLQVKP